MKENETILSKQYKTRETENVSISRTEKSRNL